MLLGMYRVVFFKKHFKHFVLLQNKQLIYIALKFIIGAKGIHKVYKFLSETVD